MLSVVGRADAAAVGNLRATGHREGRRSNGDAFELADEVAGVRRLVVAYALPNHTLTILMIVPKRVVAILGGNVRGVDANALVVRRASHDFLAPVAEDVARCRRSVLRPVTVGCAVGGEDNRAVALEHTRGTFTRAGSVEAFLQEVAVPIDSEVVRKARRTSGDDLIGNTRDGSRLAGMADGAGIGIREVSTKSTSVVACRLKAIVDLRRRCITVVHSGLVLVAGEDFLTVTIGVEVGAMLGVAVTKTGCGESAAVVVDNHRAEADLIAAVPVDVGNTEVMIAVTVPGIAPTVVVGPLPIERELMGGGIDAEGLHVVLRVAAAAEEDERMTAIEERRTEIVFR